jgi:hypothetical protein
VVGTEKLNPKGQEIANKMKQQVSNLEKTITETIFFMEA